MKVQENNNKLVDEPLPVITKDRSKVYFFIIAISALLATNVYFYFKFRSSGEKLYTVTLQKENLQIEIDRIEAELDNFYIDDVADNEEIQQSQLEARAAIAEIRTSLQNNTLTEEELDSARSEVGKLRENVAKLRNDLTDLHIRNELLRQENIKLNEQVAHTSSALENLTAENISLVEKVNVASNIKVSNIHVSGISINKRGEISLEPRAKRTDNIQVHFTVADNPLATTGPKEIYLRVINPQGSLVANPDHVFYVHGEKLQYTVKETINFTNNGEEYKFLWKDPNGFRRGAYTVLLYADNAIMGRSSVVMK